LQLKSRHRGCRRIIIIFLIITVVVADNPKLTGHKLTKFLSAKYREFVMQAPASERDNYKGVGEYTCKGNTRVTELVLIQSFLAMRVKTQQRGGWMTD